MATLTLTRMCRGRPLRPARRRLLPLFRRRVLDDPALREDAVRQRAAARASSRRRPSPRAIRCSGASPARRRTGCAATCEHAGRRLLLRRSTPIPKATKAASTSGTATRCAACSPQPSTRSSRHASGSIASRISRASGICMGSMSIADIAERTGRRPRPRCAGLIDSARARLLPVRNRASGPRATRRS